ncbi:MAG: hypothetical protein ACKO5K_01320 [Armatimonadota bacterium]
MAFRPWFAWFVCCAAIAAAHAAGPDVVGMQLVRADGSPLRRLYPAERTFECRVDLVAPDPAKPIGARLVAVDAAGFKDRILAETTAAPDPKVSGKRVPVKFRFSMPRDWPIGRYRVEVRIADKKVAEREFRVSAAD